MIIPELLLKNTYDNLLDLISDDLENAATDEDTILYSLFCDVPSYGKYNFFEQAKEIFSRKDDDSRKLEVRLFFDSERAHIPTIHINLPNEKSEFNSIGVDAGSFGMDDNGNDIISRRFSSQYELICTSDNSFEVIVIYNFLKASTIALFDHLSLTGLEKPVIVGRDLNIRTDLVPKNIFFRGVGLNFEYDSPIDPFFSADKIKTLIFEGSIIPED